MKKIAKKIKIIAFSSILGITSTFAKPVYKPIYANSYNINYTKENKTKQNKLLFFLPEAIKTTLKSKIKEKNPDYNKLIINSKDLECIDTLELDLIEDDTNISFLNYCINLKELSIIGNKIKIDNINNLPSLKKLSIKAKELDLANSSFIKNNENLTDIELNINNLYNGNILNTVKKLNNLTIKIDLKTNIEFSNFDNLKEITIIGDKYDIPIFLSESDYKKMKDKDIKINIKDKKGNNILKEYINISNNIKDEILTIGIKKKDTENEKNDKICSYILNKLEYDFEGTVPKEFDLEDPYYGEGYLQGVYENEKQLCGNYAALYTALANEAELESYVLVSKTHAWNLIKLNNKYYFTDLTYIDTGYIENANEIILNGSIEEKEQITWYKLNPKNYYDNKNKYETYYNSTVHESYNLPNNIKKKILK